MAEMEAVLPSAPFSCVLEVTHPELRARMRLQPGEERFFDCKVMLGADPFTTEGAYSFMLVGEELPLSRAEQRERHLSKDGPL
jgi:hypothetical protein